MLGGSSAALAPRVAIKRSILSGNIVSAGAGGGGMWTWTPPEVSECPDDSDDSGGDSDYESFEEANAMTLKQVELGHACLSWEGNVVTKGGFGPLIASPVTNLEVDPTYIGAQQSHYDITQTFRVTMVDYYGQEVTTENGPVETGSLTTGVIWQGSKSQNPLEGTGTVIFSDVQLQSDGPLGNISVSVNYGSISTPFTVEISECRIGQSIGQSISGTICISCYEGSVSLDNTSECTECDSDKMLCSSWKDSDVPNNEESPTPTSQEVLYYCPFYDSRTGAGVECEYRGGSAWVIKEGYWLAPAIQNVGRDTARFLELVYECNRKEACPAYNLSGSGINTAATAQRCAEGHRQNVPLCDGCEIGYEVTSFNRCDKCEGNIFTTIFQALALAIFLAFFLFCLYRLMFRYGTMAATDLTNNVPDWETIMQAYKAGTEITSPPLPNAAEEDIGIAGSMKLMQNAILTLLLYFQVFALTNDIYGSYNFGALSNMDGYIAGMVYVTFPLSRIISLSCMAYFFDPSREENNSFLVEFLTKALLPFFIAGSCGVMVLFLRNLNQQIQEEYDESQKKQESNSLWLTQAQRATSHNQRSAAALKDRQEALDERVHELQKIKAAMFKLAILFIDILHPLITAILFQVFQCREMYFEDASNLQWWLVKDLGVECFEDRDWITMAVFASILILVYSIGWPVAIYVTITYFRSWVLIVSKKGKMWVPHKYLDMQVPEDQWEPPKTHDQLPEPQPALYYDPSKLPATHRAGKKVFVLTKVVLQSGGVRCVVPVTKLDCYAVQLFCGPFYSDYEHHLYWWHSYEVFRRMAQTSFVILASILCGDQYELPFGAAIAAIALAVHAYCSPYISETSNKMQLVILANQYIVLQMMFIDHSVGVGQYLDGCLLTQQVVLIAYFVYIILLPLTSRWRLFLSEADNLIHDRQIALNQEEQLPDPDEDWEVKLNAPSESSQENDMHDEDMNEEGAKLVVERPELHDPGEFVRQTLQLHFHGDDESKSAPTLPVAKSSRLKDYLLTGVEEADPKVKRSVMSPREDKSSEELHRSRAGTAVSHQGTEAGDRSRAGTTMSYVTNPSHHPHQHKVQIMRPEDPLVRAVLRGNIKLVKKLLREGYSPMEVDLACNLTALQMASKTGNADLVTMLLEVGAGASEGLSNKLTQRPYLDEIDDESEESSSPENKEDQAHLPDGSNAWWDKELKKGSKHRPGCGQSEARKSEKTTVAIPHRDRTDRHPDRHHLPMETPRSGDSEDW